MVTVNSYVGIVLEAGEEKKDYEYKGLSTDTKPTTCEAYKAASNWSARAAYIQAIPSA